jgi:cytochrome c-type biogenesis protein
MTGFAVGAATALWLGLLTSISPCPLATNVAAMSFIGRRVGNTRAVVLAGLAYTLGRVLAYVGLSALLVAGLLSVPQLSAALQQGFARLLGPLLILVGMVLLELLAPGGGGSGPGARLSEAIRSRAESWGLAGAVVLGLVFALSFCPVSAALFFGSLVPLAVELRSRVALPSAYGVGTGLPVCAFAVLTALGTQSVARAFRSLSAFEWWARRATGVLFIVLGVYETLHSIYGVL